MTKVNGRKREVNDMVSLPHDEMQPISLRERKKRLAQATIEEAALRLFQKQGYEHTSIQDIAEAVMMSPRTFFRYFASKEEVLVGPMHAIQNDGIRFLQQISPTESAQAVLRAVSVYLASLYQQQRANFLLRYRVVMQTPSLALIYLRALMETEPALCDALCSHLESAVDRNEIRFLVAIYMATLRVAVEEWLKEEAQRDLVSLHREYLERFSSLY
jgi:AcrR family transcriptional regulator